MTPLVPAVPLAELLDPSRTAFSPDRVYRYTLPRRCGDMFTPARRLLFVMLNPSTADETKDDPTVRRCRDFAYRWGCGQLVVVNLFALRSTDPDELLRASDPVGPDNDRAIDAHAARADLIVCAWGVHRSTALRADAVLSRLAPYRPMALRLTKHGAPEHPLYVPASVEPVALPIPRT